VRKKKKNKKKKEHEKRKNVCTGLGFRSKPVFSAEIDWKLRGAVDQFAGF